MFVLKDKMFQFFFMFTLLCILPKTLTALGDIRCKCVCPKEQRNHSTNVFIVNDMANPDNCNCENVVKREELFCLKCECKFGTRNSTLIKVIIIFVLTVIVLLYLYMLIVFIQSKRKPAELARSNSIHEQLKDFGPTKRKMTLDLERRMSVWQQSVEDQRHRVYGIKNVLS